MQATRKSLLRSFVADRYFSLLVTLVLVLVVAPMFESQFFGALLKQIFLTGVFITAVLANRHRRRLTAVAIVVAAIAIPFFWGASFAKQPTLSLVSYIVEISFLSLTTVLIITSVLKDHMASVQSVYGAICIYLMIGLTWALAYSAVEFVEPTPFKMAQQEVGATLPDGRELTSYSQLVYYSFVTMSTLGFGDMTPRTPVAQTLTWMQAVAGQFYLAVLVARLISALPPSTQRVD